MRKIITGALLALSLTTSLLSIALAADTPTTVDNHPGNTTGQGIVPNCDPTLPPSVHKGDTYKVLVVDPNDPKAKELIEKDMVAPTDGCGVNSFIELIQNIIEWLGVIIIPIIVLMFGYAGFVIMTSGGNEEKLGQGQRIAKTAVIGLVIIAAAYIIVKFVFAALGIDAASGFLPKGL